MILAEILPQSNIIQKPNTMNTTIQINEPMDSLPTTASELPSTEEKSSSITSIKIPLVSFQSILATSPEFILANEFTKRRNQFVIFDENLQKWTRRCFIREPILDVLWCENERKFLLLTATNISGLDPYTMNVELFKNFIPRENKTFKCFTFLNQSTLLIAYNEWGAEYIDKWEQNNENGFWKLTGKLPLALNANEFIGIMLTYIEDDGSHLAITIYNVLTEQWRLEVRHTETLICHKAILLPGGNVTHDYKMISIKDAESDVKFLVFSSTNSSIIAIDSKWKKIQLNYKNPVQRMALFKENQLIVRTAERVDIHSFL